MTSLHAEHTVDDLDAWLETFNSFAEVRAQGGVLAAQVRCAADDRNHVAVDLEFASADQAGAFLRFLEGEVWPTSPHLSGTPTARILESVEASV